MYEGVKYYKYPVEQLKEMAEQVEAGEWDQDADTHLTLIRMLLDARQEIESLECEIHSLYKQQWYS